MQLWNGWPQRVQLMSLILLQPALGRLRGMFDPTILHELGCVPGKIQWDEKAQKLPVLYRMARENRYKVVPHS